MDLERLNEIDFWQRLGVFVQAVHTNNVASEEEKEMILNVCTLMEVETGLKDINNK